MKDETKLSDGVEPVVLTGKTDEEAGASITTDLPPRLGHPGRRIAIIGIGTVVFLLLIGGGVVALLLKKPATSTHRGVTEISLDKSQLDQLGVNRSNVGGSSEALIVSPNALFNGTLTANKDIKLNGKLLGGEASLGNLQAGNTSVTQFNVSGTTTLGSTIIRNDLAVVGPVRLQNNVTIDKLLSLGNGLNVSGDLTIGGTLTTNGFSARSLTSTSSLTVGGHLLTTGTAPGVSAGGGVGNGGTVSISGNDTAGTVAINTGQGPTANVLASISFRTPFSNVPHVTITPVGAPTGLLSFYINRSATGFSIGSSSTPIPGTGYVFDYQVIQ